MWLDTSSDISSGKLLNKTYHLEPKAELINDATFHPENILQAYSDWYNCTLPNFQTAHPDSLLQYYYLLKDSADALPIMVIDYDFHYLKPNAINEGLISIENPRGRTARSPRRENTPMSKKKSVFKCLKTDHSIRSSSK